MVLFVTINHQNMLLHSTLEKHSINQSSVAGFNQAFRIHPLTSVTSRHVIFKNDSLVYKLLVVIRGNYDYRLGSKLESLAPGTIGFIGPRDQFELPAPDEAEGFVIFFTQEFVQSAVSSSAMVEAFHFGISNNVMQVVLPEAEHRFLTDITGRLYREFREKGKDEMMTSLFRIILLQINRALSETNFLQKGKCYFHTRRFIALLDQYFMVHKMPGDYADLMAVTPAYLNNVIKETLGNTTSYFINHRILAEAKRLIMYDELNMKEVADRLGFVDSSHFSKFFKRIAGSKFSDFRKTYNV